MASVKVSFKNEQNILLKGKLDLPLTSRPIAYAVFAHVFTGSKNLISSKHISRALTLQGIAVLRFDFMGLGESLGTFSESTFSTNISDIESASKFLAINYEAPSILVGHSLGGAASIVAASKIDSIKAVATVGTPSKPEHVTHLFESKIGEILYQGSAEINIGGRELTIKKQFVEDISRYDLEHILEDSRKALLVLHSPQDEVVEITHAAKLYKYAHHPKSFVTLNNANHMLTNKDDAYYVGIVIASWVRRYIFEEVPEKDVKTNNVIVKLEEAGYTTDILAGRHGFLADESEKHGSFDFGPSPYQLLFASIGSSIVIHLKSFARTKGIVRPNIFVELEMNHSFIDDSRNENSIDKITIHVDIKGVTAENKQLLIKEIRNQPLHRILTDIDLEYKIS